MPSSLSSSREIAAGAALAGRVCLVTGGNSGIGKATAEGLAQMGASVVIVCRDRTKGERAREEIVMKTNGSVELMLADFASLDSVRRLASDFTRMHGSLHVLVNNAGLVRLWRSVTADGFETTFQVNYLSHFLLTNLLLGVLKAGAPSRIVNVSSISHFGAKPDLKDLQLQRGYGVMKAYSLSKLELVLFTYELSRKLAGTGVTVNCLHPGAVATNIWGRALGPFSFLGKVSRLFLSSPTKGAETPLYLASSPDVEGVTGKYFDGKREKRSSESSYDEDLARSLWDRTSKMVRLGPTAVLASS
jgi:NAD(P)-dependent dehydrogenase (short-subunit alcohol dehydrogenase family)